MEARKQSRTNLKIFGLDYWKAQVHLYGIGKAVVEADLQWEPEFGFGCVKLDS